MTLAVSRDAWIEQRTRAASKPPLRLMRDTAINGIGGWSAAHLLARFWPVVRRGIGVH